MHPFQRAVLEISHSVRGIRNGCILLVLTGIVAAFGANTLLYHPEEYTPLEALYHLYKMMGQDERLPEMENQLKLDELFENEQQRRQWQQVLEEGESALPAGWADEPGVRFGLGLHLLGQGKRSEALEMFHQEYQAHPDDYVRQMLLKTALASKDPALTDRWFDDPLYEPYTHGSLRFFLGRQRMDWGMMWGNFGMMEFQRLRLDVLFLTLISGITWTMMLKGLYTGPFSKTLLLFTPLALLLGWFSTWPTIFSGIWLDTRFQLSEGDHFVAGLAYFLVSVGLREELCKLLLYTPFLFWTVKANRDGEALILGALVGLGFAIEENMIYYSPFSSGVMVARMFSANVLHFTLTGATSLALTRAIRDPHKWAGDSLKVLGMAIGLHGIYNALVTHPVPGLGDMSYFYGTALAGCVYLFFREARTLFPPRQKWLSLTAIFCWGFCILFNFELIMAAAWFPLNDAVYMSGGSAISSILTGYVFLYMMREPLSP